MVVTMTKIPCIVQRKTYEAATSSKCPEFKHAACVFKGKRIFGIGRNVQYKTHPSGSGPYCTMHAEVAAITQAKNFFWPEKDLSGLSIFVMRVNKRGEIKFSKPCEDCMRLIRQYGLSPYWT